MTKPDYTATLDLDTIVKLITAVITYGAPAIMELIAEFRKNGGQEPTAADVAALLDGIKPPGDY